MKGWKDPGRNGAGWRYSPPLPTRAHLEMITETGESSGDAPRGAPAGGRDGQRGPRAPMGLETEQLLLKPWGIGQPPIW